MTDEEIEKLNLDEDYIKIEGFHQVQYNEKEDSFYVNPVIFLSAERALRTPLARLGWELIGIMPCSYKYKLLRTGKIAHAIRRAYAPETLLPPKKQEPTFNPSFQCKPIFQDESMLTREDLPVMTTPSHYGLLWLSRYSFSFNNKTYSVPDFARASKNKLKWWLHGMEVCSSRLWNLKKRDEDFPE